MSTFKKIHPDWDGMHKNLRREGTPSRVYYFEHGIAGTILDAFDRRFAICDSLPAALPHRELHRHVAIHRFLGMEWFRIFCDRLNPSRDTAPPFSLAQLAEYRWPATADVDFRNADHLARVPLDNMKAFHVLNFWETARDLIGYENLCLAIYDAMDSVREVFRRFGEYYLAVVRQLCQYDGIGAIYCADDLGYKTSTMLAPATLRELVLPWHRKFAETAHAHDKLFFLHSCGMMYPLIDDYIDDVRIDAKHSFEDAVLPVTEAKQRYGDRLTLLGGLDVDFLARADEQAVRAKTREVLRICQPGGGYFLGSGNWVTDYIPFQNYLAMLDEARNFA